jgi:hypothetical protein
VSQPCCVLRFCSGQRAFRPLREQRCCIWSRKCHLCRVRESIAQEVTGSCAFARSATLIPAKLVSFCENKGGFTPIYEPEDGCSYATYGRASVHAMASVNAGTLSGFYFSVGFFSCIAALFLLYISCCRSFQAVCRRGCREQVRAGLLSRILVFLLLSYVILRCHDPPQPLGMEQGFRLDAQRRAACRAWIQRYALELL